MKIVSSSDIATCSGHGVFELVYINHCNLFSRVLVHPNNYCLYCTCTSTCTVEADRPSLPLVKLSFQVYSFHRTLFRV